MPPGPGDPTRRAAHKPGKEASVLDPADKELLLLASCQAATWAQHQGLQSAAILLLRADKPRVGSLSWRASAPELSRGREAPHHPDRQPGPSIRVGGGAHWQAGADSIACWDPLKKFLFAGAAGTQTDGNHRCWSGHAGVLIGSGAAVQHGCARPIQLFAWSWRRGDPDTEGT